MTPEEKQRRQLRRLRRRLKWDRKIYWCDGVVQGVISQMGPGDVAIDCGANLGTVTTRLAASGARVVSFEPDPYCFEKLTAATAEHDNVEAVNAAVGAEAGELMLYRASDFDGNPDLKSQSSTLIAGGRNIDESTAIPVQVIDLPAFIENEFAQGRRISFLKLDIEGAEIDVVNALEDRGLLARIGFTVVETHEAKFRHEAERFAALRSRIAEAHPPHRVSLEWI